MFPLSVVLFPAAPLPLHVFEPRYRALTADCLSGDRTFGVVLIDRGSEVGGGDHRLDVGTVVHIDEASPLEDGRWILAARGAGRIRVTRWLDDDPYPQAMVEDVTDHPDPGCGPAELAELVDRAEAGVRRARALLSELGQGPALPPGVDLGSDLDERAWRLCWLAPLTALDSQRLLATEDRRRRLEQLIELCAQRADDLVRLLSEG
jgi:Lon protease-like protein